MSPVISNSAKTVTFAAFLTDASDLAIAKAFADGKGLSANVLQGDAASAAEFLKGNPVPGVLMVEVPSAAAAPELLNKLADFCEPTTKVVVVGSINEYSFYCWLMELGISSYLLKPLRPEALEGAWEKATTQPTAVVPAKPTARFVGFIGTRGGVGSTTLAILTTAMLAERAKNKKIALIDLDPQDGSVSLLLDLDPGRGLRDAFERPDRIDSLFLERVMQKTSGGVSVLSAEEALHEPVNYHAQAPEALMSELRSKFDIIVLDLPRRITPFVRGFLGVCDPLFAVTELSLLSLRDALRLSDTARDQLRIKPPQFVANKVGESKHQMSLADFKKGLKVDVPFHIPFEPPFFTTISAEMEMLKDKKSHAYKALDPLVASLLPQPKSGAAHAGWFKKGH